ncbi:MAG TPA: hypothetical protein VL098_08520 [Flavipsychrobacter sp.]|nr:hypothetical protein [Flavipsychrobacter sp.]
MRNIKIIIFGLLLISCSNENRLEKIEEAEDLLGVELGAYDIRSVFIQKDQLYMDYKRPYNIYIAIGLNTNAANNIYQKLSMVKYDSANVIWMDSILCLYNKPLDLQKWNIEPIAHTDEALKHQQKLEWWLPDTTEKNDNFFLYYRVVGAKGKIVKCYEKHDGRIVSQYSKDQQKMYFMIEISP